MPDDQVVPDPPEGGEAPPPDAPHHPEPHASIWATLVSALNELMFEAGHYVILGPLAAYYDRLEELWYRVRDLRRVVGWGDGQPLENSGLFYNRPANQELFGEWLQGLQWVRDGAWIEATRARRPPEVRFGPVPPDTFLWDGKRADGFTPLQWRLLALLWDSASGKPKDGVPLEEVYRAVCQGARVDQAKALLELRKRTQKRLDAARIPLLLDQTAGLLRLLPTGGG
jgi:hypothetical protein